MTTRRALLLGALLALAAAAVVAGVTFAVISSGVFDPDRGPRDTAAQYLTAWGQRDTEQTWNLFPACYQAKTTYGDFKTARDAVPAQGGRVAASTKFSAIAVRADGRYRRVEVQITPPPAGGLFGDTLEVVVTDQYGGGWKVVDSGSPGHAIRDRCAGGAR